MLFKLLVLFLSFIQISIASEKFILGNWEVCKNEGSCKQAKLGRHQVSKSNKVLYKTSFNQIPACRKDKDCYLYLGKVADSFTLSFNNHPLVDHIGKHRYLTQNSSTILLPASMFLKNNTIQVMVSNENNFLLGILSKEIFISDYSTVIKTSILDWLKRTGLTVFSSYTLIIFFLGFSLIALVHKNSNAIFLLIYCFTSALYLLSFSEYPRFFYNPELLSGGVHFGLRLLQDFVLVITFDKFLNLENRFKKTYNSIFIVYLFAIAMHFGSVVIGKIDYSFHHRLILIFLPLVAFPMGWGLLLSTKLKNPFEKKILVPISFILFIFQVNDLMVFWRLYPGYFTVKFYIPLIVTLLVFIYANRIIEELTEKSILAQLSSVSTQVAHDIRSPLAALKVAIEDLGEINTKNKDVINHSMERIQNISEDLLDKYKSANHKIGKGTYLTMTETFNALIEEKRTQYPKIKFNTNYNHQHFQILFSKTEIRRILSNLINNAIEACDLKNAEIELSTHYQDGRVLINLSDNGVGIAKEHLPHIFDQGKTFNKSHGTGLGLYHAKQVIEHFSGKIHISSEINLGTKITIDLLAFDLTDNEDTQFVLIDDDTIIRQVWLLESKKYKKQFKSYESIIDFEKEMSKYPLTTHIYIDSELGDNLKGEDYCLKLSQMGFTNIYLSTGHASELFTNRPYIKMVIGKEPPWR